MAGIAEKFNSILVTNKAAQTARIPAYKEPWLIKAASGSVVGTSWGDGVSSLADLNIEWLRVEPEAVGDTTTLSFDAVSSDTFLTTLTSSGSRSVELPNILLRREVEIVLSNVDGHVLNLPSDYTHYLMGGQSAVTAINLAAAEVVAGSPVPYRATLLATMLSDTEIKWGVIGEPEQATKVGGSTVNGNILVEDQEVQVYREPEIELVAYGTSLLFDRPKQMQQFSVTANQVFVLAAGTHKAGASITAILKGNGSATVSYPAEWRQFGSFDINKTNYMLFTYMANGEVWVHVLQRLGEANVTVTLGGTAFMLSADSADNIKVVNGKAESIYDLSPNAYTVTQLTTNYQAGYDAANKLLQFTNAQYYDFPSTIVMPSSGFAAFFCVTRSVNEDDKLLAGATGAAGLLLRNTSLIWLSDTGFGSTFTHAAGDTLGKNLFAVLYDGATATLWKNDVLMGTITVALGNTTIGRIGASSALSQYFNGGIHGIQLITRSISVEERQAAATQFNTAFTIW